VLLKARYSDLQDGNYRAFVESIGGEFPKLYIRIVRGQHNFIIGSPRIYQSCARSQIAVGTNSSKEISFRSDGFAGILPSMNARQYFNISSSALHTGGQAA
jgi:hypothetical protein